MWKFTIPDEDIEQLRCLFCDEYLSHLPVHSYPDQGGDACALCPYLIDENPIRNISYETIAKYLLFPCRFKNYGCTEKVSPSKMLEHEDSCKYKQYFCPLIPLGSCTWQGQTNMLYSHYENCHRELALQETNCKFKVNLVNTCEANYLLTYNGDLFVVQVKCGGKEDNFWVCVCLISNVKVAKQYFYQILLEAPDGFKQIKLEERLVQCNTTMHMDKMKAACIATNKIKRKLENPGSMICCVEVLPYVPEDKLNSLHTTITTTMEVNEEILHELECPICNEYMVPPIHQCVSGHSICDACKSQVEVCPVCRSELQHTRNYSLEKLTLLIKYSCKNHDFGCNFISTSVNIRNHENSCTQVPYHCPFEGYNNCKWTGKLSDILQHIEGQHEQNTNVDVITFPFLDDGSDVPHEECFIYNVEENIFRVILKYHDNSFFWSIQYIGPSEEYANFQWQLDIMDNAGDNERLFIRKKCAPLTNYSNAFDTEKFFLELPIELLRSFINNQNLIYKCNFFNIQNQ